MQDLTQIDITIYFHEVGDLQERYKIILTPVSRDDGSIGLMPLRVATKDLPHEMTAEEAHRIYKRLESVRGLVIHRLLNPDALHREEE